MGAGIGLGYPTLLFHNRGAHQGQQPVHQQRESGSSLVSDPTESQEQDRQEAEGGEGPRSHQQPAGIIGEAASATDGSGRVVRTRGIRAFPRYGAVRAARSSAGLADCQVSGPWNIPNSNSQAMVTPGNAASQSAGRRCQTATAARTRVPISEVSTTCPL